MAQVALAAASAALASAGKERGRNVNMALTVKACYVGDKELRAELPWLVKKKQFCRNTVISRTEGKMVIFLEFTTTFIII